MDWKYYNHAMIPTVPPHIDPDTDSIKNKSIWIRTNKELPLMARWTTDFDCSEVTNWWYCLRDTCFDINSINEYLNKGIKENNNYKIYLKDIILAEKGDKYITITTDNNQIYADYTSLLQVFNNQIVKYTVNIKIEE